MARKKSSTSSKVPPVASPVTTKKPVLVIQTAVSLATLSLAIFVAKDELTPLFGGLAATLCLKLTVIVLLASFTFLPVGEPLGDSRIPLLSGLVCIAPPAFHWLSSWTARLGNPVLGPLLAYTPVLAPVVYLTLDGVRVLTTGRSRTINALVIIAIATVSIRSQKAWSSVPFGRIFSPPILLIVFGWLITATGFLSETTLKQGIVAAKKARKNILSPIIFPVLATLFALSLPPTRLHSLPYVHPNGLLRILSSTPSVTGRIIVGEDYTHGFRFLRADHSLLGGVWIGDNHLAKMDKDAVYARDKNNVRLGDSIYSAFVLQEAARLQEKETPHKDALIIGLGAGIAAQAFMQHGISTSIVEIDPAVYHAARDYFGMPQPSSVNIEDARSWVSRRVASKNETYDIIVHDCFSGGGVPAHLFTSEFWKDLKQVLSSDGIVAVNFAGMIGSDSAKAVFLTLKKSFGQCRVFHDYNPGSPDEKLTSEFINMVFFCSSSSKPLTFRPASRPDYLSSYLREHVLRVFPDREVRADLILGDLENEDDWTLTDERNPLGEWQDKGALDHWRVMRTVLPDYVWATY
ncbi:S-adenosyl-L-methionine-dependent methyltransferase [Phellopilus nigrolimitatus]|nr:S-adenosyl-L-methionine-dependent methyltransferase [Phellopilus nigrolimitatus]